MATTYILYSKSIDRFYIGSCNSLEERLSQHHDDKYSSGFTHRAKDWEVYFQINNLSYGQARSIESHIKNMKSRTYIKNLIKYSEIVEKLKLRYK